MKLRSVDTAFWSDPYVENLDPTEKLLFLYLITNSLTTLSGIYEISIKRMGNETGIDRDMVRKLLDRFEEAGKVFYFNNHVILPNYQSHQKYNPMMQKNVVDQMAKLPKDVLDYFGQITFRRPEVTDTFVLPPAFADEPTPELTIKDRITNFIKLVRDFNKDRMILKDDDENDFIAYWTEHNADSKKFRREMEKVFDMGRRMQTWNKNITKNNFKKNKPVVEGTGRVITKKDTDDFVKLVQENNEKLEKGGIADFSSDPIFQALKKDGKRALSERVN